MGTTVHGVGKGGSGFLDLVNNLRVGVPGGPVVWVVYVGDDTIHWEVVGMVPPQGGPQADGAVTSEEEVREVGVSTSGGSDGRGGVTGGGDLRLPPPEHSRTVHYY